MLATAISCNRHSLSASSWPQAACHLHSIIATSAHRNPSQQPIPPAAAWARRLRGRSPSHQGPLHSRCQVAASSHPSQTVAGARRHDRPAQTGHQGRCRGPNQRRSGRLPLSCSTRRLQSVRGPCRQCPRSASATAGRWEEEGLERWALVVGKRAGRNPGRWVGRRGCSGGSSVVGLAVSVCSSATQLKGH